LVNLVDATVCRRTALAVSWEAVVAGVAVFAIRAGLDPYYLRMDELMVKLGLSKAKQAAELLPVESVRPVQAEASALAWLFVVVRILGSTFVVPPLDESFYRYFCTATS
jgi:hypothetical protein